jgi:hypothetical protein
MLVIMKIIRVFPTKTSYTPIDDFAFVGLPPLTRPEADEVHISCVFTWDKKRAEMLAAEWGKYYVTVRLGGPAYDDPGGEFVPGRYLKVGEVITSRGCPNRCSYCFVPKREGQLRTIPITSGFDILDNNLLACPSQHIQDVLEMLGTQRKKSMFRGGLDAHLLTDSFVNTISMIGLKQAFFAYDRPGDKDPLLQAFAKMRLAGFSRNQICCYVLVGYRDDTQEQAEVRLEWVKAEGVTPFAMYYRSAESHKAIPPEWVNFIRAWSRPAAIWSKHQALIRDGQTKDNSNMMLWEK